MGTWHTAASANTVLAILTTSVSLVGKVANQSFTASPRMTALSGARLAGGDAAGYVPGRREVDKPSLREVCDCLLSLAQPLTAPVAEAAGEPMRAATLDIKPRPGTPPVRRERPAPVLQIELELPLVAPEASEPPRPAPGGDPVAGRGIAVIDFYI